MDNSILDNIIRHWKRNVIIIIAFGALLYVFFSFTIINVAVKPHDGITGQPTISASSTKENFTPISIFNIKIIPRNASVISTTVDGYTTFKYVSLGFVYNSLTMDIYRDVNADKYTGNIDQEGCSTYNPAADDLLSYNCGTADGLYAYKSNNNGSFINSRVAATPASAHAVPYLGGILGIDPTASSKPIYSTSADNITKYYDIPADLSIDQVRTSTLVTSPTMTDDDFLIVTRAGDVYIGVVDNGQLAYTKYPHIQNFDAASDSVSCAMATNTAACYMSPARDSSTSKIKPSIVTMALANKNQITYKVLPLDRVLYAQQIGIDQSGVIYIKDGSNLFLVTQHSDKATAVQLAHNVTSFSADTDAYFVNDGKVYKIDSKNTSAYMIFQSPNVKATAVSALGSSVFVSAQVNDGTHTIHKYKLNATPNDRAQKRPIDVLPLPLTGQLPISDDDFVKDTLYVQLKVVISKTIHTSNPADAVDQASLADAKQQVEQYITGSGIDTSAIKIIYGF